MMSVSTVPATSATVGTTATTGNTGGGQPQNHHNESDRHRQAIANNNNISGRICDDDGSSTILTASQTTTMTSENLGTSTATLPLGNQDELQQRQQQQQQQSTTAAIAEVGGVTGYTTATTTAMTITRIRSTRAGTIRRRHKVKELNDVISCYLCRGYLVNATTIDYCVHSFCRSCIIKYLQKDKHCPVCRPGSKQIGLSNLRSDERLKSLVYKIVPGLYQNEHQRQVQFYTEHSANKGDDTDETILYDSEEDYFSPVEPISLSLEYHPKSLNGFDKQQIPPVRYLQCPAAVTIHHLKRFICSKFDIDPDNQRVNIEIIYEDEILPEDFSLMDVGYCYCWKRIAPMKFFYRILIQSLCNKFNQIKNSDSVLSESDSVIEATKQHLKKAEEAGTQKVVRFKSTAEEFKTEKASDSIVRKNSLQEIPQTKYTILKTKTSKGEQRKQQLMGDYLGNNNNNVECEIKYKGKEKRCEENQINGGKGPVKVTIIARKSNELKVKCGKHEKHDNIISSASSSKAKNKTKTLSSINEDNMTNTSVTSDFKSLRSNDIRYISNYTNNSTSNVIMSNKHKLNTAKPKAATIDTLKSARELSQKPVSKCDIVVSIPQSHVHRSSNSSDDSFENLSLAQLKTANKKVNINTSIPMIPTTTTTTTTIFEPPQNTNVGNLKLQVRNEIKLKPDVPKLKIELPSLKTKITVPKKSPEIQDSKKSPKLRKHSVEEIPSPVANQVDLTTYAKNIGLKPINQNLEEKKDVKVKSSPDNSPNSSMSSSPPSSAGSGFIFSTDSAVSSSHKKRKKGKHSKESKESGSSKRRKLHAEISSQPAEESLKLKVKITGNHKSYKAERKASSSSSDDVIITSPLTTSNPTAITTTITTSASGKLNSTKHATETSTNSNLIQDFKSGRPKQSINLPDLNKTLSEESSNINTLINENSSGKSQEAVVTQTPSLSQSTVTTKSRLSQSSAITTNSPVVTTTSTVTTKINATTTLSNITSTASTILTNNSMPNFSKTTVAASSVMSPTSLVFSVSTPTPAPLKPLPPKVLSMQEAKIPISPPLPPSLFKTTPMSLQTMTTTQTKSSTQPITKVSSTNNDVRNLAISQLNRLTKTSVTRPPVNFAIPNPPRTTNSPKLSSITTIASAANRQAAQLKRSASLDSNPPTLAKQQKLEQDRLIRKSAYAPFLTQPSSTTSNNLQATSAAKTQKNTISAATCSSNNVRIPEPAYYASSMASNYTHEILTRKPMPILLPPSSVSLTKMAESISSKITTAGLGVTITPQQQTPTLFQQQQQQQKPVLEIVRISSNIPPIDQQPITVTNNNTVKPNPPKTTRPPPPPIPLVKIKRSNSQTPLKPTLTNVNATVQQAQLIHQNLSIPVSPQPTVNSTTIPTLSISTLATKPSDVPETNNKNPVCDDIGALDLSGKSSRSPSQEKSSPLSTPPQTPTQQTPKESSNSGTLNKSAVNSLEAAVNKLKQQNQFSAAKTTISPTTTTTITNVPILSEKKITSVSSDLANSKTTNNLNMVTQSAVSDTTCADNKHKPNQQKSPEAVSSSNNANSLQSLKILDSTTNREKLMIKNQRQLPMLPKLNEINKMRTNPTVRQQNASVRNIPNPSALAFRSHQPIPMLASITKMPSPVKSTTAAAAATTSTTITTTVAASTTTPTSTKISSPTSTVNTTINTSVTSTEHPLSSVTKDKSLEICPSSSNASTLKQNSIVSTTAVSDEGITTSTSTNVTTTVTSTVTDVVKQTVTTMATAKKNLNIDQLAANLRAAAAADSSLNSIKNMGTTSATTTMTNVTKTSTDSTIVSTESSTGTTSSSSALMTSSTTMVTSSSSSSSSSLSSSSVQESKKEDSQPITEATSVCSTESTTTTVTSSGVAPPPPVISASTN